MKNTVLKTCLTGLVLSVAGLANAQTEPAMSEADMLTYSAISGAAVNIAAQPDYSTDPNVGGHLAGQAAVVIGAYTTVNDVYAGAAVTTGAWSRAGQISAGAAAGVGANATAQNVTAGAAVVIGANGNVGAISAGAAITLGAGATAVSSQSSIQVITHGAGSNASDGVQGTQQTADAKIVDTDSMDNAMQAINAKFDDNQFEVSSVESITDLSGLTIGDAGNATSVYYSAINLQANTTLRIDGNVTVITSEAMTIGAGAEIVLEDGATVTWILDGALNLGAGSKFSGIAYVKGAVSGATSDVACGNIYATGAISMNTIGLTCPAPQPKPPIPTLCIVWDRANGCIEYR
jgi:hypothetical protein